MKKYRNLLKISFLMVLLIGGIFTFKNNVFATDYTTMSWPLEATLSTNSTQYSTNEVVQWEVDISGGFTTGPDFDVHFTDSEGESEWVRDLNTYHTSFNFDYQSPGTVTGYISVYGGGQVVTDSVTIEIH
ncbi:hypothetical protein RZN22_19020 [Bacillaceae bacterium S4-13-58]